MPSKVSTPEPMSIQACSRVRIPLAIALAATLVAGTASRAGGARKAAQPHPSASARPATLRDLDSLLAAGLYGAAVAPALELAAALKSSAAPDSNATATLDRVVQALLAGGRGADSSTIDLAVRAVRAHERLDGAQGIPTAAATTAWARCLAARRNDAAAASAFNRGLAIEVARSAPDSLRVAETLEWLGRAQIERGDAAGASGPILRSLAIREHALGVEHREVARSLDALAVDLGDLGDYAKARAAAERALAIREKGLPPRHPEIAESLDHLGTILEASVEWGDDRLMRGVLKFVRNWIEPKHSTLGWDIFNSATESSTRPHDFTRAGQCFDRAVKIRVEVLGELHPETATSVLHRGRYLQVIGDEYRAMSDLRRVLATRERVFERPHPAVAQALVAIGDLLADNRDPLGARPYFERALAIQERTLGPADPEIAASLLGIAKALAAVGDTRDAVDRARQALAIREKALDHANPMVAEALIAVAELEHQAGDDAASEPRYERALALFEEIYDKKHPRVADACEAWALARRDRRDLKGAKELLERALDIRESAFGVSHPDVGRTLNELVWVDDKRSFLTVKRLGRAGTIFEASYGPGHPALAQCRRDLALTNWWWGAGDSIVVADALRAEAERQRLLVTALSSLPERQALALAARTPRSLDLALSTSLTEGVDRMLQSLISSRGLVLDELGARRLGALDSDSTSAPLEARFREASGRLASLMVRAHGQQSTQLYRQLVNEAVRDREQAEGALGVRAGALGDRARMHRIGLAEVKAALPPGSAMVSFVRYQRYEYVPAKSEEQIAADAARNPKPGKGEIALGGNKEFMDPSLVRYVRTSRPPFNTGETRLVPSYLAIVTSRDTPQTPVGKGMWAKFKRAVNDRLTGEEAGGATRLLGAVRLGDAVEIDSLVARWVDVASHGPSRMMPKRADEAILSVGQALRERIWEPVVKVLALRGGGLTLRKAGPLGPSDHVFVVPDGSLQLLNFAALPAADGSYLIEHGPLIHLLSAERDLVLAAASPGAGRKLLAFGGANFDDACATETPTVRLTDDSPLSRGTPWCEDFGSLQFAALPATSAEVAEIGGLWRAQGDSIAGEAVILTGPQACEAEFKRLAHGSAVIHLATHGFFVAPRCTHIETDAAAELASLQAPQTLRSAATASNPLSLCGLVLAGANRRADAPAGGDDGILTAQEIGALDLRGTQWAVLSACETGVGEVVSGEGVFGLRRAFQMAGARTQIMSLWSVEDDATRRWMNMLYQARFAKGVSTMEAVRAASLAQLALRRESGLSTHPFYWAPFVASGDWR